MRYLNLSLLFVFFQTFLIAQDTASFEAFELPLDVFLNDAGAAGSYQNGVASFPNSYNPDFGGFWESGWAISTMRNDSTTDFTNLYTAKVGSESSVGNGFQSSAYAVGQQNALVKLTGEASGKIVEGVYITNSFFSYNSLLNGDDFAKKFGGEDGTDPDFFKLDIRKYSNGVLQEEGVEFYLADFRFEDNSQDYIIADWQWVDLSSLGNVDSLQFTLSSSDAGEFGINTPLFFCIDDLITSGELSTSATEILTENASLMLYPNPTVDIIIIESAGRIIEGFAQIFDLSGKQVLAQNINLDKNRIRVSSLPGGAYILAIKTLKGKRLTRTFIKK